MDLGLTGKVALVAASSKGIGLASARMLANEGCKIVMCSRGEAALRAAAESIRKSGAEVRDVVADVTDVEAIERVVNEGKNTFGGIDILVTNSGGPPAGAFETLTPEMWDAATRVLLTNVVEFARRVLPGMKERRWGRIINITSIAAKQPVDGLMLSNSLRAAVTGFARTLANEVAPHGVTVNNVLPGYTRTERVEELARSASEREGIAIAESFSRWESQVPMNRLGEPDEIAAVITFLASVPASYVTGASVAVDGGWIRSIM